MDQHSTILLAAFVNKLSSVIEVLKYVLFFSIKQWQKGVSKILGKSGSDIGGTGQNVSDSNLF